MLFIGAAIIIMRRHTHTRFRHMPKQWIFVVVVIVKYNWKTYHRWCHKLWDLISFWFATVVPCAHVTYNSKIFFFFHVLIYFFFRLCGLISRQQPLAKSTQTRTRKHEIPPCSTAAATSTNKYTHTRKALRHFDGLLKIFFLRVCMGHFY